MVQAFSRGIREPQIKTLRRLRHSAPAPPPADRLEFFPRKKNERLPFSCRLPATSRCATPCRPLRRPPARRSSPVPRLPAAACPPARQRHTRLPQIAPVIETSQVLHIRLICNYTGLISDMNVLICDAPLPEVGMGGGPFSATGTPETSG